MAKKRLGRVHQGIDKPATIKQAEVIEGLNS